MRTSGSLVGSVPSHRLDDFETEKPGLLPLRLGAAYPFQGEG